VRYLRHGGRADAAAVPPAAMPAAAVPGPDALDAADATVDAPPGAADPGADGSDVIADVAAPVACVPEATSTDE